MTRASFFTGFSALKRMSGERLSPEPEPRHPGTPAPRNRRGRYYLGSRGVAQPGSAPALGAGGPAFESRRPDQVLIRGALPLGLPHTLTREIRRLGKPRAPNPAPFAWLARTARSRLNLGAAAPRTPLALSRDSARATGGRAKSRSVRVARSHSSLAAEDQSEGLGPVIGCRAWRARRMAAANAGRRGTSMSTASACGD